VTWRQVNNDFDSPEDEDEQNEQREEHGDVVHGTQHDDQLIPQRRHKPD